MKINMTHTGSGDINIKSTSNFIGELTGSGDIVVDERPKVEYIKLVGSGEIILGGVGYV